METLVHADIFFFITSIAVVIFTTLMIIVGIYVIVTLRDIRDLLKVVKDEALLIVEDVEELRENVRDRIQAFSKLAQVFVSTAFIKTLLKKIKKKK